MNNKYETDYTLPKPSEVFIDTHSGEVVNKNSISDIDVIEAMAVKNGVNIAKPKKGCKHCYGLGREGYDSKTKAPIPCRCLFRKASKEEKNSNSAASSIYNGWNREMKRRMGKANRNRVKNSISKPVTKEELEDIEAMMKSGELGLTGEPDVTNESQTKNDTKEATSV